MPQSTCGGWSHWHGIVAAVGLMAAAGAASADDHFWTGAEDQFWHRAMNWVPHGIPAPFDNAYADPDDVGAPLLIILGADTAPLQRFQQDGYDLTSVVVTSGHRLTVNSLDFVGEMSLSGAFTEFQVSPRAAGGSALDADNLEVRLGAYLTITGGGLVQVAQDFILGADSTVGGNGTLVLSNQAGTPTVVGALAGDVAAIGGRLTVRALDGGRFQYTGCTLTAASEDADVLVLDGVNDVFDAQSSIVIGNDADMDFTSALDVAGEIDFVSSGRLTAPRLDFVAPGTVAVAAGHGRIEGIAALADQTFASVAPGAELTFAQPVAFESGSSMAVDGVLRCIASTTYSGGVFTGAGTLSQFAELNVLAPTVIDMPDGNVILGFAGTPIDIDLFSGGDLTITARSVGGDNAIAGTTNVQEAVLEINTVSPTGLGESMVLNSAVLRGTPMVLDPDARLQTMGFQDAIDADVTYADGSELAVGSDRLFLNGRTTLAGAEVTGTGSAHFSGDLVARGDGVTSLLTVHHPDWDGSAESGHRTMVREGATLQFFDARSIESTFLDGYDGTITIESGGKLVVTMHSDDEWKMDGVLSLLADTAQVVGDTVVNRGRVEGDGVFAFTPLRSTGMVAPGSPTGQLTVSLDPYEQTSAGTLEIELGGTEAGVDHDVLAVAFDTATLAGTLHVRLVNGFEPEIGHEFTVVTASSVIGTFDEVIDQAGVTVTYTADSVVLTYVGGVDPADVNGDGVVDFGDILALLGAWGPCPRNRACPEDINADGAVSFADLLIVLGHWT